MFKSKPQSNHFAELRKKKISIVAHDAGGANILIEMLLQERIRNIQVFMDGPARILWDVAYPDISCYESLESAIITSDLLITGSGWASRTEHRALAIARAHNIECITVLDHWVNYAERFIRNGEQILPDQFWVTDSYALEIAKKTFLERTILQIPNYYLERQLRDVDLSVKANPKELLYVLEPMRSNWGGGSPGEFQALDFFMQKISCLGLPKDILIILRPHPSDSSEKYDGWIRLHSNINVHIDRSINISNSLSRATWVVGCESFALVLGLMAGKIIYCSLPPWAPACRLPHAGIIRLSEFG